MELRVMVPGAMTVVGGSTDGNWEECAVDQGRGVQGG